MTITPAFMTRTATAKHLGISYDTFLKLIADMRRAGFPVGDPVMGRYVTADVEAWIESRRQINTGAVGADRSSGINFDAL